MEPPHPHRTRFQARVGAMPPVDPTAALLAKLEEFGLMLDEKTGETHRRLEQVQIGVQSMEKSMKLVSDEQQALLKWKPEIEAVVSDLKNSVADVTTKVDLFIH